MQVWSRQTGNWWRRQALADKICANTTDGAGDDDAPVGVVVLGLSMLLAVRLLEPTA
jgi:hypothetical protein